MEKIIESAQTLEFYLSDTTFSLMIRNELQEFLFFERFKIEANNSNTFIPWLYDFFENKKELISKEWKQVRIGFDTPKYVLVPEEYFNPDLIRNYLEQITFLSEKETVFSNLISDNNIRICFAMDTRYFEYFQKRFNPINIIHSETIRLNFCFKQLSILKKEGVIILFIHHGKISFSIVHQHHFILNTTINYISFDDIIFHINRFINQYFTDKILPELFLFSDDNDLLTQWRVQYPNQHTGSLYNKDFSANLEIKHLYLCE